MPLTNEKNRRGISGNILKYSAAVLMLLNHLAQFLTDYVPAWFHDCGLPVASVFVFLGVEGFHYTHSRSRYLLQLYIGYVFMLYAGPLLGRLLPIEYNPAPTNDIFGSLFLVAFFSLFFEWIRQGIETKSAAKVLSGALLAAALLGYGYMVLKALDGDWYYSPMALMPSFLTCESGYLHIFDYNFGLVLLGLLFYFIRAYCPRENLRRILQAAAVVVVNLTVIITAHGTFGENALEQLPMLAVVAAVLLYNGKRGKGVNPKFDKWFFYIFYPTHIYLLYTIAWAIQQHA